MHSLTALQAKQDTGKRKAEDQMTLSQMMGGKKEKLEECKTASLKLLINIRCKQKHANCTNGSLAVGCH